VEPRDAAAAKTMKVDTTVVVNDFPRITLIPENVRSHDPAGGDWPTKNDATLSVLTLTSTKELDTVKWFWDGGFIDKTFTHTIPQVHLATLVSTRTRRTTFWGGRRQSSSRLTFCTAQSSWYRRAGRWTRR
jgi:hypothetical protein